jgi:hypothetical protein
LRRGLRIAREGDVLDRIESAAREIVPSTRAASVLAGELAVFWYAFLRPLCVVAQEPVLRHRLVSRAIETLLSECPLTATIDLMDRRIAARSSAIYLTNGVPEPWSCFDGLDIL